MDKILLIIQREFLSRVKKKSFIIMTFLGPILMGGLITGAILLTISDNETYVVQVIDESEIIDNDLPSSEKIYFSYSTSSLDSALKQFETSPYSIILYIPNNIIKSNSIVLHYKKYPSLITQKYISAEIEKIIEQYKLDNFNIDKEVYAEIKTRLNVATADFKQKKNDKYKTELTLVGFFFAVLIYMFIFLYGVQVMRGVIEEKTSRIVEVIISSVKPFQLMLGKITGIALVGLTQFLLWVILTTGIIGISQAVLLKDKYSAEQISNVQVSGNLMQKLDNTKSNQDLKVNAAVDLLNRINFPLMIGMFLFYFLGGYLLYASLFAAVGAAVDNEADTQQFMMPITIPLIFGFIVAEFALQNPDGPAVFWFSIIPLTSPVVMMVRIAGGINPSDMWQLYLSMFLLVAGFIFTTWVAAKIYRTGILMYGKKPSYKELIKWLKYS
jgi:ABC-2 type transport system permease protein